LSTITTTSFINKPVNNGSFHKFSSNSATTEANGEASSDARESRLFNGVGEVEYDKDAGQRAIAGFDANTEKLTVTDAYAAIDLALDSVVKIFTVTSSPSYFLPWQNKSQRETMGSGYILNRNISYFSCFGLLFITIFMIIMALITVNEKCYAFIILVLAFCQKSGLFMCLALTI